MNSADDPFAFASVDGGEAPDPFPIETRVSPYRVRPAEWEEFVHGREWKDMLRFLEVQILAIQDHILTGVSSEEYPILIREMVLLKRFTNMPGELIAEYHQRHLEKDDGS